MGTRSFWRGDEAVVGGMGGLETCRISSPRYVLFLSFFHLITVI